MTVKRVYHLLSDLEYYFFMNMDFAKEVIDIREQYPLPLDVTEKIAADLGVVHPREPATNYSKVMTTDFLLTVRVEGKDDFYAARSMKYNVDLTPGNRTSEKQAIESAYWRAQSIDWKIVTEKQIENPITRNIRYIYGKAKVPLPNYLQQPEVINMILSVLLNVDTRDLTLSELHEVISSTSGHSKSDVQNVFYWCLWHKYIQAELHTKKIEPNQPLTITSIELLPTNEEGVCANY